MLQWQTKLKPAKGIPFRTLVWAESRPLAIECIKNQFVNCSIVEPPKEIKIKDESNESR